LLAEYFYDASGYLGFASKSKAYTAQGVVEVRTPAHDARGRVLQQEWIVPGAGGGTFRMDYAYNEADQRTSLQYPGSNGGQQGELVSFGFNGVGQLQTVTGGSVNYLSQASYNALGQAVELVLDTGNLGLTRRYDYDPATLRLNALKAGKNAPFEDIQKLSYSYDNVGNVQSISDASNSNQTQTFGYNWLDRLVSASTSAARLSSRQNRPVQPHVQLRFDWQPFDELRTGITSYADNAYTYGITAAFGDSYACDANGNRVKGTVSGTTTVYIAGLYEWQNGATTTYIEGPTGIIALRRAGHASDGGVKYMLGDHLGSTGVLVNQNGMLNAPNYY